MKIKYLSESGLIPLLLWLMTACTADLGHPLDEKGQDSGTEIPINILPKLSVGQDTRLSKLRVIIFSTRNSKPYDPKVLISNELVDVNKDYTTITYVGYNDIYVIGNEPVDLSGVKSPDDLKAIRMNTESSPTTVLYKQLLNVRVKSKDEIYLDGETSSVSKLEINLQHVMAKLSVNFDLSTEVMEGGASTGVHLDFESMEIAYIPKSIGLIPQKYDSDQGYLDNLSFTLSNTSVIQNHFTWSSGEIYLPEHLLGNNDYRTILRIKGKANSITHIYTLPVGDAMNSVDSRSTDWNVTRNRHYKLTIGAITGYGEELLEASARVAGWSEINVPIEIPGAGFIALSSREIDVKSIRFFTYTRFVCSDEVVVKLPNGVTLDNQLSMDIEYDDETKRSGRIGFKKGNWNTGADITYTATLMSGMASVKLDLKLFKREISSSQQGKTNWAYAMGYPGSANTTNVGIYNAALYRKQANPTGCNAYYVGVKDDPVRGQGCWRLATIAENQASSGLILWCIEEVSAKNAYLAGGNGYFGNISKGSSYPYYCVLDVRPPELSDFIVSDVDIKDISKDEAPQVCTAMGSGWRLPTGKETDYVFKYAGTNGLPNNFFSDSYWGKENDALIVATIPDPDGSETTDDLRNQTHTVRCVKSRY